MAHLTKLNWKWIVFWSVLFYVWYTSGPETWLMNSRVAKCNPMTFEDCED